MCVAVAVLVLTWPALIAIHSGPKPLLLPRPVVIERLREDPSTARIVSKLHWTRVVISTLDRRYEAVWLYDGYRLALTAVISAQGKVAYESVAHQRYVYGSDIANAPVVLLLLCAVFVLMSAVWPLRRLRNLDVLVTASFVGVVVLVNAGMLERMALLGYGALLYLAIRCGWRAFARRGEPAPSTPLYEALTRSWTPVQRRRLLRLALASCALIVVMVGLSSEGVVDVGYAVMEGATKLVHGVLPYGHIPDVLHGDTYPIGSYLLYVPFAWLSPVRDEFDSADFTLVVAVLAGLITAWMLFRGTRLRRPPNDDFSGRASESAGLRTAIAWLTFPPLLVTISTGTTDVALAAILGAALVLWRRPTRSTALLAMGAWFKLVPVALIPIWLARLRGRSLWRTLAVIVCVSAPMIAVLVALGGWSAPRTMLHAVGYQATRQSENSLWASVGSVPWQQLVQAATLALVAAALVRIRRDRAMAGDLARLAALSAAVLVGLQLSGSYWSYMYLAWLYPCLALSLLAPCPSSADPPD